MGRRPSRLRLLTCVSALLTLSACAPAPDEASDSVGPTHAEPQLLATGDTSTSNADVAQLVAAPARTARTIAALMFDIGGGPPDESMITTLLKGDTGSLTAMYREISYGMQDLQIDLYGPYTLDEQTCLPIECCGPKTSQPNGPQVQGIIAELPKTYDHYFWVYGKLPPSANCGTWGDEGNPGKYAKYSSYSFHSLVGYSQELGHNFGMTHEPIMKCPSNATLPDDPSTCTHSEYGSTLSFMGSGGHHTSAYHKVAQGWLSGCNGVKVGGSGTYTLLPVEVPCDGTQILQIKAPKTRSAPMAGDRQGQAPMLTHYYLELRTPRGFDSSYEPQVFVSIGPDLSANNRAASYVYQLNRTPDTQDRPDLKDGGYAAGQTFTDPGGGLSFTVDSVDQNSAQVTVTATATGADTCLDGSTFTAPGPGFDSCNADGAGGSGGMGGMSGTAGRGTGTAGRAAGGAGAGGAGSGGGGMPGVAGVGGASPAGAAGMMTSASGNSSGGSGAVAAGGLGGTTAVAGSGAVAGTSVGSGGAAAGRAAVAGTGGGSAGMSVASTPVAPPDSDAGCGCRTTSDSNPRYGSTWASAVSVLLFASRARRRRRMQETSSAAAAT